MFFVGDLSGGLESRALGGKLKAEMGEKGRKE